MNSEFSVEITCRLILTAILSTLFPEDGIIGAFVWFWLSKELYVGGKELWFEATTLEFILATALGFAILALFRYIVNKARRAVQL